MKLTPPQRRALIYIATKPNGAPLADIGAAARSDQARRITERGLTLIGANVAANLATKHLASQSHYRVGRQIYVCYKVTARGRRALGLLAPEAPAPEPDLLGTS